MPVKVNINVKKLFIALIMILALNITSCYARDYDSGELLNMTRESLRCDTANNTAYVRGVGLIHNNTAQGKLLARRAALTDARRGLLILKRELNPGEIKSSGHVPALTILSEGQQGNLYFVEVEAALSELLRNKYYVYMITNL